MIDKLRLPFLVVAGILLVLAVMVELGSALWLQVEGGNQLGLGGATPGLGIPYLALVDGLLLFTVGLIVSPLLISHRAHGRIQGILTFIVALLVLLGAILLVLAAIALLVLMVSLLLAVPFGTIAYMAAFADFPTGAAAATLSTVMLLKLAFAVCLILAHQRFLENKGLVVLILTSLGVTLLLGFLHNLPPRFLAAITDDIAAIVIGIVAAIWALVYLVGAIPAIVKALRVDKAIG